MESRSSSRLKLILVLLYDWRGSFHELLIGPLATPTAEAKWSANPHASGSHPRTGSVIGSIKPTVWLATFLHRCSYCGVSFFASTLRYYHGVTLVDSFVTQRAQFLFKNSLSSTITMMVFLAFTVRVCPHLTTSCSNGLQCRRAALFCELANFAEPLANQEFLVPVSTVHLFW